MRSPPRLSFPLCFVSGGEVALVFGKIIAPPAIRAAQGKAEFSIVRRETCIWKKVAGDRAQLFTIVISQSLLLFALSAFLGGGGIHGLVVGKNCRPLPLSTSLGVEAIYRLDLRDRSGKVRQQMVTAEIFQAYEVGDEFDDHQTIAEVRRQHLARQLAEEEKERALADAAAAAQARHDATERRVADSFRRHDMLPEREAF